MITKFQFAGSAPNDKNIMKNKGYKQMKQIIAFLLLFNTLTVNA